VFAYAEGEGEGTTLTEAAAAGSTDPEAFGERVRRKAKRLAGEQLRSVALPPLPHRGPDHTQSSKIHCRWRRVPGPKGEAPRSRKEQHAMTTMPLAASGRRAGDPPLRVRASETAEGLLVQPTDSHSVPDVQLRPGTSDLYLALSTRTFVSGQYVMPPATLDALLGLIASKVLVMPCSERWREAVSTAVMGAWCDPMWDSGYLPVTALGALRAEARSVHRQLMPVWRRRNRHGRVLSLDADLDGLSLYDLVAADIEITHATGGIFEDDRLNRLLSGLDPVERQVVFAYAEGEGTTWTEAAAAAGAVDPVAFGDRVRRKVKRLAGEQRRRAAQRRPASPVT
jgi:hypothetical protein